MRTPEFRTVLFFTLVLYGDLATAALLRRPREADLVASSNKLLRTSQNDQNPTLGPRSTNSYKAVPNGQNWYDVDGSPIKAWGGNIYKEGSTYYWVGQASPSLTNQSALVNLYKSSDMLNWDKVGVPISVYTKDKNGNQLLTNSLVERPKLMKSKATGKYVIWAHWETANSYSPSEVIVATADKVGGPYTITSEGHRRPGAGYNKASAMGDRVGGLRLDFGTSSKATDDDSHPYMPVQPSYPPTITQYGTPTTSSPYYPTYVAAPSYGTATFSNVRFNVILKAVAVEMTAWNASLYEQYVSDYSVSASTYIVQYATKNRSTVTKTVFDIGDPGDERTKLVKPSIGPTIKESKSDKVVWMNSGDAAFITVFSEDAKIYYTIDGSDPDVASASQYVAGTRLTISGSAGSRLTVKAIAAKDDEVTDVVTQIYEIASDSSDVPVFAPIVNYPSGTYAQNSAAFVSGGIRVYSPSYRTNCYYTLDGLDPDPPMLGDNLGYGSRDMTVWEDPKSGASYLVSATDNIYGRIWQLEDDLTDVVPEKEYDVFVDVSREAPALVRNGGASGKFVYLITSGQSGWYANQAQYMRAVDIAAGFSLPRDSKTGYRNGTSEWTSLAPVGDASTFGSQPTWIQNIGTDKKPAYIYIGDRYNASSTPLSSYVFTTLYIDDDTAGENGIPGSGNMTLTFNPLPAIDVAKGVVKSPSWKLLSLNKPVAATTATALTAAELAAGTYNFSAAVANDGVDYDVSAYDAIAQYYLPSTVPYFWQVDLGHSHSLSWVGLSFRSVSGSDAVERYLLSGSTDNVTWTQLVDNTDNILPGYKSHLLDGKYRYVRLNVTSVWDVAHGQSATWEAGLYEMSVYGSA